MLACAIRGGPVELVEPDAADARVHWSEAALAIAIADARAVARLPLAARESDRAGAERDADRSDQGRLEPEHRLERARILRGLAWVRAGTEAGAIDALLARWPEPGRLHRLLAACEAIRVGPVIRRLYPGAAADLARLDEAERRLLDSPTDDAGGVPHEAGRDEAGPDRSPFAGPVARALAGLRLGMPPEPGGFHLPEPLGAALLGLARRGATTADSIRCAIACWRLERGDPQALESLDPGVPAVPDSPTSALPASAAGGEPGGASTDEEDDKGRGKGSDRIDAGVPGAGGEESGGGTEPRPGAAATAASVAGGIRVDEWDYTGRRFLRGWCRIVVARPRPLEVDYRGELMRRERSQARRLRRQFARLRDAATRRRRVFGDGEEIDADDMVRARVERKAGIAGDEPRMIRREHARRDVAVALLLDVSASTDFVLRDPPAAEDASQSTASVVLEDDDPFLWSPSIFEPSPGEDGPPPRRVIDVARDAMGLLAQALDSLGDRFALYAFSGCGREEVDFLVAKDFEEAMAPRGWQALAGLEPMRSTRMGAAIRHATDRLARRPERMRVLIVVSDGYPDDVDYGPDRRDVEYGLRDTARAIEQARRRGIDTLLVTVDRAGHDYLRRMCPPGRYRVIDEIDSLAGEIARAYRTMTG